MKAPSPPPDVPSLGLDENTGTSSHGDGGSSAAAAALAPPAAVAARTPTGTMQRRPGARTGARRDISYPNHHTDACGRVYWNCCGRIGTAVPPVEPASRRGRGCKPLEPVAAEPILAIYDVSADGGDIARSPAVRAPEGTMFLTFNERRSDSPFVERIWRSRSLSAGVFLSVAASHFEIAVTRHNGKLFLTVRGPETRATPAECPAEGEWLGIRFKLGTFMPAFLPGDLKDRHDVTLPGATNRSFWLNGSACEYPDFENADTFVAEAGEERDHRTRRRCGGCAAGTARRPSDSIDTAPLSARDRNQPSRSPPDRTRQICDDSSAPRRFYPRHRA